MIIKMFQIDELPISCQIEKTDFDIVVVSARRVFKNMINKCKYQQLALFSLTKGDGTNARRSGQTVVYLNNFCLMIDTVFRLTFMFSRYYSKLLKRYNVEHVIILNDVRKSDFAYADKLVIKDVVRGKQYNKKMLDLVLMWKLKGLRYWLEDEELEDFDNWESYFVKEYPGEYDYELRSRNRNVKLDYNCYAEYITKLKLMEFMRMAALSQMYLNSDELFECCQFVLKNIKMNNFKNLSVCEFDNQYEADVVNKFDDKNVLYVTDWFVNYSNSYFVNKEDVVCYPFMRKNQIAYSVLNENCKLMFAKFKKSLTLINLFDVCEKACNGKILDINSAYSLNLFNDPKMLYIDVKMSDLFPDNIEEDEYMWLIKEYYFNAVAEWAIGFNHICKIKIKY